MTLLFSILPEYSSEMLFFSGVSMAGLFFLLIGWLLSVFDGEGTFELFSSDVDDIDGLNTESGSLGNSDNIDFSSFNSELPIPSFFSLKVLRIVMLCFGLGGNTALRIGLDFTNSLIMASVVGLSSGIIVYKAFTFIYKQTIHNFTDPVIIGREGRVILKIPADGLGQIRINIVGKPYIYRASNLKKQPIIEGTIIKVRQKKNGTCVVEPV